ncbi:MerR family transcriptional regulator [Labedaea rhizosphaerae]|uniref:MerR-like DNA binding protein n=1 Tax=Labedaea rhizosphaerae TaxID=598644 RepID=A0A4V3CXX8_LABRH|nr:MerR family transcriptional regulator [Labedaea rhizosphaerae]TDP91958.1 MerR-like DNA binding protein [Labedaea rhizosphaerae]
MTAAGRPARTGFSIGAVLDQLRDEFPDVTISKIRFLEAEGLVSPARAASGYRQFSSADIDRLRYVLAAQRDQYLPLRVIKEQLDAADRGARPALHAQPDLPSAEPGLPTAEQFVVEDAANLTRAEFLDAAGIDAPMLAELEQYGLVGTYDRDAVLLARTVAELTRFGIEPRHLRVFQAAADRTVGLVEQVVAPLYQQRDPGARGRADDTARQLTALSVSLHTLLVKAGLRRLTGP